MKKMLCTVAFVALGTMAITAQNFSAKAGYTSGTFKVENDFFDGSVSEGGFHIGVAATFELTELIDIHPELIYTNINDGSLLQIPVFGLYKIGESGFNVQAGPQFNISLEETGEDFSVLAIALSLGAGYDITDAFYVEAHYALQLTNSYTGDAVSEVGDITSKTNFFNIGLGYRF